MSTIFFQVISGTPEGRIGAWIPELIVKAEDGVTDIVAHNLYSDNFYLFKHDTLLRRRPDPPPDPDNPPPIPARDILADVYMLGSITQAGEDIIGPIHDKVYSDVLRAARWATYEVATGILVVPVHTHEFFGEVWADERRATQLVLEEIDVAGKTRDDAIGKPLVRDGVTVQVQADKVVTVGRRGRKEYPKAIVQVV